MASSHRDWASLPLDLIYSIREKLVQFSDYVRFIAVCQQWRHCLEQDTGDYKQRLHILKTCHNKLPMLMIDTKENHESEENHELDKRCLFSVAEGNINRVRLPLPCNKRFLGSSFGWLFIITEEKPMVITLLNPFTGVVISLPPLKDPHGHYEAYIDIPQDFIAKAVLLSDPFLHPNNYEVVVIYNDTCQLAMFKSGQNSWNFFDSDRPLLISDVIYYGKGQSEGLYAVSYWDELVKIDFATGTEKVLTKKSAVSAQVTYLVQSQDGDLLLVQRFWTKPFKYSDNPDEKIMDKTFRFAVFKLLHQTGETGATWVQIKSLGEQALFLGDNHSLSVSTLEFPECLPNCIYYTEQYHVEFGSLYVFHGVDEDSGIFHLEEGSFRTHYISDPLGKNVLPPIWFVPNMKGT